MRTARSLSPWQDARFMRAALAAVAISLALHAALLAHGGARPGPRVSTASAHGSTQPARAAEIRLVQAPAPSALARAAGVEFEQLAQAPGEIAIEPSAGPAPVAAGGTPLPRTAPDEAAGEPGDASRPGYFSTAEVDQPALPLADWQIPRDELPAGRSLEFSARVYVSLAGRIDRIELVAPQTATPELAMVLDDMRSTVMLPARLQGHPVASVRTIAFRIDVERGR